MKNDRRQGILIYTIKKSDNFSFSLAPENTQAEIIQNVFLLLNTQKGSVPLGRDIGLSNRFLGLPVPSAESLLRQEIIDAVEAYEPRAEIKSIEFETDEKGVLSPILEVEINV